MTDLIRELQRAVGVAQDGIYGPATHSRVMERLGPVAPLQKRQIHDGGAFFRGVRAVTGQLNQVQVDVINDLLTRGAHWSVAWMAYGLATAWHEARLQPIEEIGKGRGRKYGVAGKHDQIAYGRGLVQLTWDYNYERADKELCLNGALVSDYDKALEPDIAAAILVGGMEEGWFTGKSLGDYIPNERASFESFKNARRIINGTDRDELIANYALKFQDALSAGGWS